MPSVALNRVVRFGPFQADLKAGELRRNGQRVRLQELPFQVLSMLLERHGDVVTREELRNKIWPADTFVDFDHGLNKAINKIRGALGDRPELPRYIETVARRGYRFIAPVASATPPEPAAPAPKLRLAVLPFENLSDDPTQDYFSDGMTDEMIAQLGRLDPQRLGVIARTSAMQYKRTAKDIAQIGRELSIDYIVEGSVRRSGNRVRIAAQLIKVSDQTHLWSESYEREMNDMLALQHEVARRIGRSLALELLPEMAPSATTGKLHPDAHEHYLRGRFLAMQRTETALLAGIECFERALAEDAEYAPAHAGLADCYSLLSWFGALRPHEAAPKARTAAQRALAIDDKLGPAHCSLALMHFWYEWRWNDAEAELRRAIELNPSYPAAHHWYGSFLSAMGRLDEAVEQHQFAIELDPLSLIISKSIADPYYYGRQFDIAEKFIKSSIERDARFAPGYFDLGRCLLCRGNAAGAVDAFERTVSASQQNPSAIVMLACACAFAGQRDRALQLLAEAQQKSVGRYLPSPLVAQVYLGLDDLDTAFQWMHKGIEERSYWLVLTRQDPFYDSYRSDPRFQSLLETVGLLTP